VTGPIMPLQDPALLNAMCLLSRLSERRLPIKWATRSLVRLMSFRCVWGAVARSALKPGINRD